MRTYIVYYYKEINDECVEQQIEILIVIEILL